MDSYRHNGSRRSNDGYHPHVPQPPLPILIPGRESSSENHDNPYGSGHSSGSLTRESSGEESSGGHSSVSAAQGSSGEDLIFDMSLSESSENATPQTRNVPPSGLTQSRPRLQRGQHLTSTGEQVESILCHGCRRLVPPSEHRFHRRYGCHPPGHTPPTPIAQRHASSLWTTHPLPPPLHARQHERLQHHQHGQYHQHQQVGPSTRTVIHPLGLAPAPMREQDDSPHLSRIPVQLSEQARAAEEQRTRRRRSDTISQRHYSYLRGPGSSRPRDSPR